MSGSSSGLHNLITSPCADGDSRWPIGGLEPSSGTGRPDLSKMSEENVSFKVYFASIWTLEATDPCVCVCVCGLTSITNCITVRIVISHIIRKPATCKTEAVLPQLSVLDFCRTKSRTESLRLTQCCLRTKTKMHFSKA